MPSPLQTLKITIYIYSVRNHSLHIKFHPYYTAICKMAGGKHKKKTTLQRYSKEEVLQAILDLDTDSCDTISSASSNEIPCEDIPSSNEHNTHEIDDCQNTPHFPIESSPKVFTQLENIASTSPVSHVDLEFRSSGEITSSPSQPQLDSSTTSYGKYSSTDTEYPNSSPTFPSDDSTDSTPTPLFPEYIPNSQNGDNHNDSDSGASLVDFDVEDIPLPKSQIVTKKRAVLQLTEIPFSVLMQWIRTYLISIEKDANKPEYPVPDMDKNQKRNFRRTTEKFKMVNGHLKHLHIYIDEKNKLKRGTYNFCYSYLNFKI